MALKKSSTLGLSPRAFNKRELEYVTGLNSFEYFDLVRQRPDRGTDNFHQLPFFTPSQGWLGRASKKDSYKMELAFQDLVCLSILKCLKMNKMDKSFGRFIWNILGTEEEWLKLPTHPSENFLLETFDCLKSPNKPTWYLEILIHIDGTQVASVLRQNCDSEPVRARPAWVLYMTPQGLREKGHPIAQMKEGQVRFMNNNAIGSIRFDLNKINSIIKENLKKIGA